MSASVDSGLSGAELADMARRVLAEQTGRRDYLHPEAAQALWNTAAGLGWFMLTIPEERDGLGQGLAALAPIYGELGRALSGLPLLSAMLTVDALLAGDGAVHGELLAAVAGGEAVPAAQLPGTPLLTARRDGDALVLDGVVRCLLTGIEPSHALAHATLDGQSAIVVLPLDGAELTRLSTWDETRQLIDIGFAGARHPADVVVATGPEAEAAIARLSAHFDLGIAWDSIGAAEQILTDTVEYSRTRQQFGRQIGSFQAIKHRCADMKTWLESARALNIEAARLYDAGDLGNPLIGGARLYAAEVFRRIAMDAVQLHGGIGFTWEHDCHLFLKRALLNEQLGGSPEDYQDRLFEPFSRLVAARQG